MADGSAPTTALQELLNFPLIAAIFGRRSRRFGLGMEIPSGPLAFKSRHEPVPLSELEQALLVAAATGVTGWHFGVPFTSHRPRNTRLTPSASRVAPPQSTPGSARPCCFTPMIKGFT